MDNSTNIPETAGDLPGETMVFSVNRSRSVHLREDCQPMNESKKRDGRRTREVPAGSMFEDDPICKYCLRMFGLIDDFTTTGPKYDTCMSCHGSKVQGENCPHCELMEKEGLV